VRSIDLLPPSAKLVGIDVETALGRERDGRWHVAGVGVVTVYSGRESIVFASGDTVTDLV